MADEFRHRHPHAEAYGTHPIVFDRFPGFVSGMVAPYMGHLDRGIMVPLKSRNHQKMVGIVAHHHFLFVPLASQEPGEAVFLYQSHEEIEV